MSVRTHQRTDGAIFFCTFTCWGWMRLIEMTNCYDRMYHWMRIAHEKGFRTLGFAIMPNHVHLLIYAPKLPQGLRLGTLRPSPSTRRR